MKKPKISAYVRSSVRQRSESGLGDSGTSSDSRKAVRSNSDWRLPILPACTDHIGRRPFPPAGRRRRAIRINYLLQSSRRPPCAPRKPFPVRHVARRCPATCLYSCQRPKRRTWLVILANVWAGISPAVTLRRRPGLFLSFRLTNNIRILDLYVGVVPLQSLYAVSSTVRARCNMRSDAAYYVSDANGKITVEDATYGSLIRAPRHHKAFRYTCRAFCHL